MIPEAIPSQYSTLVLVALLVLAFVVAFKIMELVFETLTVSALSGAFYAAYTAILGGGISEIVLNDLLLFAFLGAGFYMTYSFLSSAYTIAARIIHIPYTLVKYIWGAISKAVSHLSSTASKGRESMKRKNEERKQKKRNSEGKDDDGSDDDSNNTVKEVVLRSSEEKKEDDED